MDLLKVFAITKNTEKQGVNNLKKYKVGVKMNRTRNGGKFTPNRNTFVEINDLLFCFHESGQLLFFTESENADIVTELSWAKHADGYAATNVDGKTVSAHRILAGAKQGDIVDHANGIKVDNRKINLRICNKSQNAYNSKIRKNNKSGHMGVYLRKDTHKWSAEIKNNNKKICLGCYDTKEEAIKARKKSRRNLYEGVCEMPINSKEKGKRGELELCRILKEYGYAAKRAVQYCGANGDADVVGLEGIHIECKRTERTALYDWISQSKSDAREGELPVVAHRKNNSEWLWIMDTPTFMRLYGDYEPPVPFTDKEGDEDGER